MLLNLIVNAGDAIVEQNEHQEGVLGRITVRTLAEGEWVVVEVEDDGCGVPEEIQQRVFDPFFTTKCVGKGTGQGLSIAHNVIVNQHQGSIFSLFRTWPRNQVYRQAAFGCGGSCSKGCNS